MSGALLDHLRSVDWVTRTERKTAKALQQAAQDLGPGATLAEQAKVAGVDLASARAALTADGRRPVSLEETLTGAEHESSAAAERCVDETADTEGRAFVRSVLGRVAEVIEGLPKITRLILILRYYEGMSLAAIAEALGLDHDEVTSRWKAGIFAVHGVMLRAAMPG